MSKVLVIRTSSLGDAAMLVPVLVSVATRYPQSRFTILTRATFAPLFQNLSFNISVIPLQLTKKHKGFIGLLRTLLKVVPMGFTHVADEHDVLRSKVIRFFMLLTGRKVRHINKGRDEKEEMILSKKLYPPLKPTTDRYMDTFERLGFPAPMTFSNFFDFTTRDLSIFKPYDITTKQGKWIGIAPFAKHKGKIYPLEKSENIVRILSQKEENHILLLGGKDDFTIFEEWRQKYPNITNLAGKLNLEKELLLISYMDVVISMDSANMHLASLVNVPVVSIWGATHPSLGFYGYKQDPSNAIQIDLECRPCSVYGNKPCARFDYACLHQIPESIIINKVNEILEKKENKPEVIEQIDRY